MSAMSGGTEVAVLYSDGTPAVYRLRAIDLVRFADEFGFDPPDHPSRITAGFWLAWAASKMGEGDPPVPFRQWVENVEEVQEKPASIELARKAAAAGEKIETLVVRKADGEPDTPEESVDRDPQPAASVT